MMNVIRSLDIRHIILSSSIYRSSSQSDFDQLMLLMYYEMIDFFMRTLISSSDLRLIMGK